MQTTPPATLSARLERDGVVLIPDLLGPEQLAGMRDSFARRLKRMRWNDVDGYELNEPYRHMVPDVLTLDQGFVDAALDPRIVEAALEYVGPNVELCEAKGWKSLPTRYDFHGWHGDSWYDQTRVDSIPRELKLGIYLTDVTSGQFRYVKGTHGKEAPRWVGRAESEKYDPSNVLDIPGPAGTAFLFDTSGIHRQSIPILEERMAVFFTYHDPAIPLQAEDVEYYRYHPLLLNAAFLGDLSERDRKMLGFGNKTNYLRDHERRTRHTGFHRMTTSAYVAKVIAGDYWRRVRSRLSRLFGRKR